MCKQGTGRDKSASAMADDEIFGLLSAMREERVGGVLQSNKEKKATKRARDSLGSKRKKRFIGDTKIWDDEYDFSDEGEEELLAASQAWKTGGRGLEVEDEVGMSAVLASEAQRWRAMSGLASKFKELCAEACKLRANLDSLVRDDSCEEA